MKRRKKKKGRNVFNNAFVTGANVSPNVVKKDTQESQAPSELTNFLALNILHKNSVYFQAFNKQL